MSTLTSNAKLYSYLEGYEVCCYTGQSLQVVTKSIRQLLFHEFRVLFPENELPIDKLNRLFDTVDKFYIRYYDRMKNIKSPAKVATLADNSKSDKNTLDDMISKILGKPNCQNLALAYISKSKNPNVIDLCERCPRYAYHKFCLAIVTEAEYEDLVLDINFHVAEYKYLALALLSITNILIQDLKVDLCLLTKYYSLYTHVLSCAHIYELMNPSGEPRMEYIHKTLKLLTSEPLDYTDPTYQKYDQLLTSVFEDVKEGKLPYAREMHRALSINQHIIKKPFDEETDYYCSMKGTAQSSFTGIRQSLPSSAFEVDYHKYDPRVKAFDEYIGYKSRYMELSEEQLKSIKWALVTLAINNPGKFKERFIVIGDNASQDRCNVYQNRSSPILSALPNDCTGDQDKGRQSLRTRTLRWYLEDDPNKKIGITSTDFSNATDTIDQRFTHRVVEFIFGPEYANFWDYVSELPKEMRPNGRANDAENIIYIQKVGQPQGMLGSFNIFALCHHFLFLMDMKELGMTNYRASQYYTVLGDDSCFETIVPEVHFYDRDDPITDSAGIARSYLEIAHFDKCTKFANLIVNLDKTTSVHCDSVEAKLDFAKVTYRNGELFSPVPFRLAMRYSQSFDNKLAVSLWRADRGDPIANNLLDLQIEELPENSREAYRNIIRCGELPFLDAFKDKREYSPVYRNTLRYCLAYNILTVGLAFTNLSDSKRDSSRYDQFDRTLATVFSRQQSRRLDNIDPNHKVMQILYKNGEIISTLHEIYKYDDFDDQFIALCMASFMKGIEEEITWTVYQILAFGRQLQQLSRLNLSAEQCNDFFPELIPFSDFRRDYNIISQKLITRGITKSTGERTYLFRKTFDLMNELQRQLKLSFEGLTLNN